MENISFAIDYVGLAKEILLSEGTVQRWMSECPERLPPSVNLFGDGKKRGKKIWIRETVREWLKKIELKGIEELEGTRPASPKPVTVREEGKRGPGRPKKLQPHSLPLARGEGGAS